MTRTEASKTYKQALAAWNIAANGADEKAFEVADANLAKARSDLVVAETAAPTSRETKRANEILRLRNRGFDI